MASARFSQSTQFDVDVTISEASLPIHVRRLVREEWDAFWKELNTFRRRGSTVLEGAELEAEEARFRSFAERVITDVITVDEGQLEDAGVPVTTGAGVAAFFYTRPDAYGAFVAAVKEAHLLTAQFRKNSNSPQGSGTGSGASSQARGGDAPEPTAESAATSAPAPSAGATGESSASAG